MDFISDQVQAYPELTERYSKLGELFQRKLWHELTRELSVFLGDEGNRRNDNFILIYERFICKFENKLNQLDFAKIVAVVAASHEPTAAVAFFQSMLEKQARLGVEATLFLELKLSLFKLSRSGENPETAAAVMKEVKTVLDSKKPELDALQGLMDTCVHSAYYKLATEYYKETGPPETYYKHALMLLAYTPFTPPPSGDAMATDDAPEAADLNVDPLGARMSQEDAISLATDMSLAAISGDGVYNFGEVLATPIVGALENTPNHWLGELLRCFNRGDIEQFNAIVNTHSDAYYAQPALKIRHDFIKEKLALLSLMNFVFETPSHDRNIPFAAIAERTMLKLDQVEWLCMRAMSLELIKGTLDEVDQILHVEWVQPRVLDKDQLTHLVERLDEWSGKVTTASNFIEDETLELFS